MKVQFVNRFLFYAILEIILLKVFCLKNTINSDINEKANINKAYRKHEFEVNQTPSQFANQTQNIKNEKNIHENNNDYDNTLKSKNLLKDRRDSKIFNITSPFFSNLFSKDISNITKKFSCFYFNEEDFSVYDMSQLDKEEY